MNLIPKLLIGISLLSFSSSTKHTWRLINNKHWQIVSSSPIERQPQLSPNCLPGMVEIKGKFKLDISPNPFLGKTVEALQKTTCTKWINRGYPERCQEFNREKWLKILPTLPAKEMNYCIDQFEYPNQKGQYPIIYINYTEAKNLCQAEGKRLCNEEEFLILFQTHTETRRSKLF